MVSTEHSRVGKLTSLDLHLKFRAGLVIETDSLEDVGCGIYPAYYMKSGDMLLVSTSAASLIADSGVFELNPDFKPPIFLRDESRRSELFRKLRNRVWAIAPGVLSRLFMRFGTDKAPRGASEEGLWYESWETIDKRVQKLRAFEQISPARADIVFHPDYAIRDTKVLVRLGAYYMKKFVHDIENAFPDCEHVVMTGGKDSQLISLIPKLHPDRWHIFSAEPNYPLVSEWIAENNLRVSRIIRHDNRNEESVKDLKKKIYCGDLCSNPRHIRWVFALKKVGDEFAHKCIFWAGTSGDPINRYHSVYHAFSREHFFDCHMRRAALWQGNYHQVVKNVTGCPLLSPYHSREIWNELYLHLDPSIMTEGMDLRMQIGEELFGKPVRWIAQNPGPEPYRYKFSVDLYRAYLEQIRKSLKRTRLPLRNE